MGFSTNQSKIAHPPVECSCSRPHRSQRSLRSRWSVVGRMDFWKEVPTWPIPITFTQHVSAGVYQGLTIRSLASPSVYKHGVDLIPVTGQQLVPLTVILSESRCTTISKFDVSCISKLSVSVVSTSSTNLAWPCRSIGHMAFCSSITEPGYTILLPTEWVTRKLQQRIASMTLFEQEKYKTTTSNSNKDGGGEKKLDSPA